jgi:large subunit ribosomal protein L6
MLRTILNPIKLKDGCSFDVIKHSTSIISTADVLQKAKITGSLGSIELDLPSCLDCLYEDGFLKISFKNSKKQLSKEDRAKVGTFKALLLSSMDGVSNYHSRVVIFTGTGISVKVLDKKLNLEIGKSHPVLVSIPESISCVVQSSDIKQIKLGVKGIDSCLVGKFVRELCDLVRNPYKNGKHIWPEDRELITREGKKKK